MQIIKTLYIIGNGFDIHHGMPTAFKDFYNWMKTRHYFDALSQVDEIYGFSNEQWWGDLENSLGELDMCEYALQQTRENYPDFSSDDFRESDRYQAAFQAELDIMQMQRNMKSRFAEWIEGMQAPDSNKMLPISIQDTYFISFNYTPTLELLYRVPSGQILHLHGSVYDDGEYILGNGKSHEQLYSALLVQEPSPSPNASQNEIQEFYENNYDSIYEDTKEKVVDCIASMQKPVDEIIENNRHVFNSLKDVERVCVYGLSFSDVDIKYIAEIIDNHKSPLAIQWEISYYLERDKAKIMRFVSDYHIPEKNIQLLTLDELQNKNQLSLF